MSAGDVVTAEKPADAIVKTVDLRKVFALGFLSQRRFEALAGVDITVARGRTHGFLGPNGAGKTTTIKILNNLIFPSSGSATVFGHSPGTVQAKRQLGYLPENPTFPDHLTGEEVLRFYGQLGSLGGAALAKRVDALLEQVRLQHARKIQVRRYSKGMTQRLGIAQSMLSDPELLIWDEPMSGLDPIGRREVKELMQQLQTQGKTLFFSTHIISDVEEICEDVSIIVGGKITKSGAVRELISGSNGEIEVRAIHLPDGFQHGQVPPTQRGSGQLFAVSSHDEARALVEKIWAAGGQVISMHTRRSALEDIFLAEVRRSPLGNKIVED